jgi:hypothetical protein
MAVRTPAPAHSAAPADDGWAEMRRTDAEARPNEGRAERWATWVLIYLAALMTSLAVGSSAWALGLTG